jgi:hypothetical protein
MSTVPREELRETHAVDVEPLWYGIRDSDLSVESQIAGGFVTSESPSVR